MTDGYFENAISEMLIEWYAVHKLIQRQINQGTFFRSLILPLRSSSREAPLCEQGEAFKMISCAILDLEWDEEILGQECKLAAMDMSEGRNCEEKYNDIDDDIDESYSSTYGEAMEMTGYPDDQRNVYSTLSNSERMEQRQAPPPTSPTSKIGNSSANSNSPIPSIRTALDDAYIQERCRSLASGKEKVRRPRRAMLSPMFSDDSFLRSLRKIDDASQSVLTFPSVAQTLKRLPTRRKVRFDSSPPQLAIIDYQEWDDHDALWWSDEDQENFFRREDTKAMEYTGHLISKLMMQVWKFSERSGKVCNQAQRATFILSDSPARGMELDLLRELGDARDAAIQSVLVTQDSLKHAEPQVRRRLVGKRYRFMSMPSVRFARLLAQGDAQFVVACQSSSDDKV